MRTTRIAAVLSGTAAAVLLAAAPASAHVTVHGPEAAQDGFAKLIFQVPTEKDIPTTRLEVDLPAGQPMAFVSVKRHAGWTYAVTTSKLATPLVSEGEKTTEVVTKVVWTADKGQGIKPGEFDEFEISAGRLPKVESLTFKALQTYADGSVVRWIDAQAPGGSKPEHPAPALKLAAASGAEHMTTATATATASPNVTGMATMKASETSSNTLGGVGVGLGALGLATGLAALARTRKVLVRTGKA